MDFIWLINASIPNFSFLGGIEVAEIYLPGWVGLTLIIRLSLRSNWTELDWTGTELGNMETNGYRENMDNLNCMENSAIRK